MAKDHSVQFAVISELDNFRSFAFGGMQSL